MSRREEVGAILGKLGLETVSIDLRESRQFCRTLADEVDARDAIIDKLIAMLEGEHPICIALHARACEIAGRKS